MMRLTKTMDVECCGRCWKGSNTALACYPDDTKGSTRVACMEDQARSLRVRAVLNSPLLEHEMEGQVWIYSPSVGAEPGSAYHPPANHETPGRKVVGSWLWLVQLLNGGTSRNGDAAREIKILLDRYQKTRDSGSAREEK